MDFVPPMSRCSALGLSSDYAIRYPVEATILDSGHELVIGGVT